MAYLFDTNHCVYLINGIYKNVDRRTETEAKILKRFRDSKETVFICYPVLSELYFGVKRSKNEEQNHDRLKRFLSSIDIAPIPKIAWFHFGEVKAELQNKGKSVSDFDLLIACVAKAYDLILVTNDRYAQHLPNNIKHENWIY